VAERAPYRGYDVLANWQSPSWNEQTRAVVAARLNQVPDRRWLSESEWSLLEAVVARLIPQPDRRAAIPITPWIDDQLAEDRREGFRGEDMPVMRDAWRLGLAAIEAEAGHGGFAGLSSGEQDALLARVQAGEVKAAAWARIPASKFFSDILLKTVAGIYYAHPSAWSEIGFGGPASPRGYVRMGFDERDPWEAKHGR
jgi:hypothetical protein